MSVTVLRRILGIVLVVLAAGAAEAAPDRDLPLRLEANRGQADGAWAFVARAGGERLLFGPLEGMELLPGKAHYLLGADPRGFLLDVPTYRAVVAGVEQADLAPAGVPALGPALARDRAGHLYLAGHADEKTVFLTQLDPSGATVLRTSYVDGFDPDAPLALAVTPGGEALLAGSGGGEPLVVRVADDGRSIVSRAICGGKAQGTALAVALDADGNAWVAGRTANADGADAFVAQIDPAGAVLFASTVGGFGNSEATGIALDPSRAVYLTGTVGKDALVAKLDANGMLVYALPFGGSGPDAGVAIALTPSGDVVVAGTTRSADLPIIRGAQGALGGESDAFLATFDPATGALLFSTYAGGPEEDRALALAVDRRGTRWIAGCRETDAFVSRIDPERTELLAGEAEELASGLVLDGNGDAWVAGLTRSPELPEVSRPESARGGDVFLARVESDDPTPQGVCPGTKNFTGAVSLAWENAGNWSGGTLPLVGDDVCVSGFNVTLASGAQSVNSLRVQTGSLTISGGTVTIAAASEVNGPLTISGGTLTGAGNLTVSGLFTWTGGTISGAGSLTTNGAVSLGGFSAKQLGGRAWTTNATVTWTDIGQVVLSSGAAIQNSSTWDCQGTATLQGGGFNNTGVLKRSTGAGTCTLGALVHTGSVLVQAGTLAIAGGSSTGSFDVATGATLQFSSGVFQVNAGTSFTGSGTVAYVNLAALLLNVPITMPATLTVEQSGTLTGTGTLTIGGTFNWSGGSMQSAGITTCNGPVNLVGVGAKQILSRTLNLNGGAVFSGTGAFAAGQAAVIHSPGTFDCQIDATLAAAGGALATFDNTGTFKKSGGAGTTSVNFNFVNAGAVLVQSGTLNLTGLNSSTGSFDLGAGRTLQIGGGAMHLNAGTSFTGTGSIFHSAGNLNVNTPITIPAGITFGMTGGFQQGNETLTLAGPFNWSGGTLATVGATICNGSLNVSGSAALAINQRNLITNAATLYTGTGTLTLSNSAEIQNNGTWDAQSDLTIAYGGGGLVFFRNPGTFRKSAGAGTMTVGGTFINTGTVDVQSGTLSPASYTQTAGATKLTGGAFTSPASIAIQGGTLAGSGTVTGSVAVSGTGALAPGLSAGTLTLTGTYNQAGPSGAFNVELGGLTPGTQHDRVNVGGAATLAGNLNVTLINGFVPVPGNSFTFLTYPSRIGTFTLNLPAIPCVDWQVDQGATALVLTAVAAAPPAEIAQLASTSPTAMTWAAGSAAGIRYDVLRGRLDTLPVGPGAGETCLATGIAGTSTSDATIPAVGTGFWYVVRGRVPACAAGTGTYGFATGGVERVSTACP